MPPRKKVEAKPVVDVTVQNQESLGSGEVKDRNPDPQLVTDATGTTRDVSKSEPEIVDPDKEANEARQARLRQTDAAMNAKDFDKEEEPKKAPKKIVIKFLASGLTAERKVWKAGEVLELEDSEQTRNEHKDTEDQVWYEQSAKEQEDRYGKVFFEKE